MLFINYSNVHLINSNFVPRRILNLRVFYKCFPLVIASLGCSYLLFKSNFFKNYFKSLCRRIYYRDNFNPKIIDGAEECMSAVSELRKKCSDICVLGLDCEWLSNDKQPSKVALLQLATIDGTCSLFRLCSIGSVPKCLSDLLADKTVFKTGVAVTNDARKLYQDYGVVCNSCIDVRYMAKEVGLAALGLGKMSEAYLSVELDKNWRIRCSDWEANKLTDKQVEYAAKDALMSVLLFQYFNNEFMGQTYPLWKRMFWTDKHYWSKTEEYWSKYCDLGFSEKSYFYQQQKTKGDTVVSPKYVKDGSPNSDVTVNTTNNKYSPKGDMEEKQRFISNSECLNDTNNVRKRMSSVPPKENVRKYSTRISNARKSALYHNIFVQAPDGTVLCTCDNKKAEWYLNKGIAQVVCEDPLTIRLNFEPAGKTVGVECYYAKPKNNICVVCSSTESMRRKNIVPHEYRKYFPEELKEHSSHDVLLFCEYCHFKSQFFDQQLRNQLAFQCSAPFGNDLNCKVIDIPLMRQVKSAAKALLYSRTKIPKKRVRELEILLLNYLKENPDIIPNKNNNNRNLDLNNPELLDRNVLENLTQVKVCLENEKYQPHGMKVVEYFKRNVEGGIHALERTWRKHFITNMAPKYLPELWSVDYVHNSNFIKTNC